MSAKVSSYRPRQAEPVALVFLTGFGVEVVRMEEKSPVLTEKRAKAVRSTEKSPVLTEKRAKVVRSREKSPVLTENTVNHVRSREIERPGVFNSYLLKNSAKKIWGIEEKSFTFAKRNESDGQNRQIR